MAEARGGVLGPLREPVHGEAQLHEELLFLDDVEAAGAEDRGQGERPLERVLAELEEVDRFALGVGVDLVERLQRLAGAVEMREHHGGEEAAGGARHRGPAAIGEGAPRIGIEIGGREAAGRERLPLEREHHLAQKDDGLRGVGAAGAGGDRDWASHRMSAWSRGSPAKTRAVRGSTSTRPRRRSRRRAGPRAALSPASARPSARDRGSAG